MNISEWKVTIRSGGHLVIDDIIIFRKSGTGIDILKKDGNIDHVPFGEATDLYTIRMPVQECREIISAFVKYAQDQGFKSSDESFSKGKLEATEKHLDDMRTLVFKK